MTERMKKETTVGGLLNLLLDEHVALRPYSGSIMVVVNRRCVSFDEKPKDGDEVALFPPVGGGEQL
jgi:molybdopterin converting factor small subunit